MNVILEALCPYVYNQCPGIKYIIIFAFCKEQAYVVSMHARKQCRNAQETFSFINMFSRTFSKTFVKLQEAAASGEHHLIHILILIIRPFT